MENPFTVINERLIRIEESLQLHLNSKSIVGQEKEFLNVHEVSELLDLAPSTIYNLRYQEKIPFYKNGKRLYFKKSEILQFLERGRSGTLEEGTLGEDFYKLSKF